MPAPSAGAPPPAPARSTDDAEPEETEGEAPARSAPAEPADGPADEEPTPSAAAEPTTASPDEAADTRPAEAADAPTDEEPAPSAPATAPLDEAVDAPAASADADHGPQPHPRRPAGTRLVGDRARRRAVRLATTLVVLVGALLRVRQWAHGRAFWLDELLLQRAMSQQKPTQLLEPLGFAQSAPPGWLAVQHLVLGLSDSDERAARLLPLLAGVGALVLTVLLGRLLLGGAAALAATAMVAFSPSLISYSAEFKQYSSDVFWVLLVLLLGCRLALGRVRPERGRVTLAAVGAVAVWFSHAGALVTVGVFAALGLLALARRSALELRAAVACAVPAAAGLAVEYAALLRRNAEDGILQEYWARAFPPHPLTWSGAVDWAGHRVASVRETALGLARPGLLLTLLLAGLLVLALRRPPVLPLLLVPTAVVAAAGLAGSYPIAGRLALFFVPLVALVVAAPLDLPALAARLPLSAAEDWAALLAAAATVGLVVLVGPQVGRDWAAVGRPEEKQEARTVLAAVATRRGPRDLLLVDGRGARYAAAFYAPRVGAGPFEVLEVGGSGRACQRASLGARLRAERRYDRVWLLASHTRPVDLALYRAQLADFGPVTETVAATGAAAFRFDRAAAPPPAPRPAARRCLERVDPATLP